MLVAGNLFSAVGYGGLAFVHEPWQAFAASLVAGVGTGLSAGAGPTLIAALVSGAERASAFAVGRIAINLGIGVGAAVGGFIASTGDPRSFQTLYLLDAATFVAFAFIVLALVPPARVSVPADEPHAGFRMVLRDRAFISLMAANVVFIVVGFTLFGRSPALRKARDPGHAT